MANLREELARARARDRIARLKPHRWRQRIAGGESGMAKLRRQAGRAPAGHGGRAGREDSGIMHHLTFPAWRGMGPGLKRLRAGTIGSAGQAAKEESHQPQGLARSVTHGESGLLDGLGGAPEIFMKLVAWMI